MNLREKLAEKRAMPNLDADYLSWEKQLEEDRIAWKKDLHRSFRKTLLFVCTLWTCTAIFIVWLFRG